MGAFHRLLSHTFFTTFTASARVTTRLTAAPPPEWS